MFSTKQKRVIGAFSFIFTAFLLFALIYFPIDYKETNDEYEFKLTKLNIDAYFNASMETCTSYPQCGNDTNAQCIMNETYACNIYPQTDCHWYPECYGTNNSYPCINDTNAICVEKYINYCHCMYYNDKHNISIDYSMSIDIPLFNISITMCDQTCKSLYYSEAHPTFFTPNFIGYRYNTLPLAIYGLLLSVLLLITMLLIIIFYFVNRRNDQKNQDNPMMNIEILESHN